MKTHSAILKTYETILKNIGASFSKEDKTGVKRYKIDFSDSPAFFDIALKTMTLATPSDYRLWLTGGWNNDGKGLYVRIDLFARNFTNEEYYKSNYADLGQVAFFIWYYPGAKPYNFSLPGRACDCLGVE